MTPAGMTISASIVGTEAGPLSQSIDARWLMAYAAALGETAPRYFDTLAAEGPIAHPLFPVCYEWPVAVAMRDKTLDAAIRPRGVHATHHLTIHRCPRAGDTLTTTARVIGVEPRRAGTLVTTRFETVDARGHRITTTDYGSVYRAVTLAGSDVPAPREAAGAGRGASPASAVPSEGAPGPAAAAVAWQAVIDVPANAAHVYTECARIWNPIHTDGAVARRAGLSAPILHGTATLALAVSRVIARDLGGDPSRVREIRGRFTGMVAMPSTFTVRGRLAAGPGASFDAVGPGGAPVLSQGVVIP
jgi:acyl dehydratase